MPPSVEEFYEGKNILITGGTGFVGKVRMFIPDLQGFEHPAPK